MKIMNPSAFVPRIMYTSVDKTDACILLNTCLACSLGSILHKPLDDTSAKFIATCVVIALENLHEVRCRSLVSFFVVKRAYLLFLCAWGEFQSIFSPFAFFLVTTRAASYSEAFLPMSSCWINQDIFRFVLYHLLIYLTYLMFDYDFDLSLPLLHCR